MSVPVHVGISLVYWGLTPQQQPGSYQGGEMMMKSVFWCRDQSHVLCVTGDLALADALASATDALTLIVWVYVSLVLPERTLGTALADALASATDALTLIVGWVYVSLGTAGHIRWLPGTFRYPGYVPAVPRET